MVSCINHFNCSNRHPVLRHRPRGLLQLLLGSHQVVPGSGSGHCKGFGRGREVVCLEV